MGKALIIIVLGLSVIIGALMMNLNANTYQGLSATVDYFEKTHVRLLANSGVEVYLEKLRQNKTLTGTHPNNSLMNGTYDIYISGPDTLLKVKSVAHYNKLEHTTLVTARRKKVELPNVNSAMYISSKNMKLLLNGNCDIDGNDHNLNGTKGPEPSKPGIGVDDLADSAYAINVIKPAIAKEILGAGGAPSVRSVEDNTDWLALTENAIFSADIVLGSGSYSNGTVMGTTSNPKVTYVNGDVKFSNATGAGIMIINGNVHMSGQFRFDGIVLVYGKSSIQADFTGQSGIYGGTILVGESVDIKATGNALFYYSSEAINLAKMNLKSSRFEILSWWE